jgi:hypothetical protein
VLVAVRGDEDKAERETWVSLLEEHNADPQHVSAWDSSDGEEKARRSAIRHAFNELITKAAEQSATICEVCGADGAVLCIKRNHYWYKTLCRDCADKCRYRACSEI